MCWFRGQFTRICGLCRGKLCPAILIDALAKTPLKSRVWVVGIVVVNCSAPVRNHGATARFWKLSMVDAVRPPFVTSITAKGMHIHFPIPVRVSERKRARSSLFGTPVTRRPGRHALNSWSAGSFNSICFCDDGKSSRAQQKCSDIGHVFGLFIYRYEQSI